MSKIEWTGETWNPIAGCTIVSPGCTNCYAMRQAARIERMIPQLEHYRGLTKPSKAGPVWTGKVALAPERTLLEPLRRRKPTTYFVNSMSDLFHEDVPDEWIDGIFAVMALCWRHEFQVLTKRSARLREWSGGFDGVRLQRAIKNISDPTALRIAEQIGSARGFALPLPNVWLGVSCERQKEADERIPHLLATPAAVRFVSAEPLLGSLDLRPWLSDNSGCESCDDGPPPRCGRDDIPREERCPDRLAVWREDEGPRGADGAPEWVREHRVTLDWVIVGGESGRDARPMHPDWACSIRDQCQAAGVAFFFKQWGEWAPTMTHPVPDPEVGLRKMTVVASSERRRVGETTYWAGRGPNLPPDMLDRVGKKAAGRLLDGREWNEMPAIAREPDKSERGD